MFGFGKKKELVVSTPVAGQIIDITAVADATFAELTMGDGFAVEPTDNKILAPCDGEIAYIADTNHALVVACAGLQLLIHIGIDTVALDGKGFTVLVAAGDRVRQGQPLVDFDREVIQGAGKACTTMVVVLDEDEVVKKLTKKLDKPQEVLTLEL